MCPQRSSVPYSPTVVTLEIDALGDWLDLGAHSLSARPMCLWAWIRQQALLNPGDGEKA